jgi:hypothetical protein
MCAILTALKNKHNGTGHGKKTSTTEGCKLLLVEFQFIGISRHNRIPNRGVFKLNLTNVKYNMYAHWTDEKEKDNLRTRPNNLIQ